MQEERSSGGSPLQLRDGSRVAVIGGGPAGSFFGNFLLQMVQRLGIKVDLDIFEPRDFSKPGLGCNMCGGVISESLVQSLATEGINLPPTVIQRRIDSYSLHMDVGSVVIPTPLHEMRIAAVQRGPGPRTFRPANTSSFDGYLLEQVVERGARVVPERVTQVSWQDGLPCVHTKSGSEQAYDFLATAVGVNSAGLTFDEQPGMTYEPPGSTKTYISEFYLGRNMVKRYLGSSMHVFLLDIPRLDFAALIPKSDYVTICLLGTDIDKELVQTFMKSEQVRECMPPLWSAPKRHCHCSPRINIKPAVRPFGDRFVFVGDSAATKLYKDGIGAAYRTAKAAAMTAAFKGLSAEDFRKHYWPACKAVHSDNRIGRLLFAFTRQIQKRRYARRAVWRMVSAEQKKAGSRRRMSLVLWDVFTGSAPYRSVFLRTLHPAFWGGLLHNMAAGKTLPVKSGQSRRIRMASGGTGALGKCYKDGEIIYRQGDVGDCMYAIQKGKIEVSRRDGDKEFILTELGDGDFFGEMAIFEQEVRPTTARAVTDTWVYTLERDSLLRRIHEDPSLAFRLIQQMSYRVRELESALIRGSSASSL